MLRFALAAFLPAYFLVYALGEPSRYRAVGAVGGALSLIVFGLLATYVARRNASRAPHRWGAAIMAFCMVAMIVDRTAA